MTINDDLLTEDNAKENNPLENKFAYDTYEVLGKDSPLKTLLSTTWGPFLAEIVGAAYGIVDTFWISRYTQLSGNAAMTLASIMDTIVRAFGMFMSSAASSQLSHLRGENLTNEVPQVFADLFRITLLVGLIVPAILLPLVSPLLSFFNAEGDVRKYCHDYLFTTISGAIITCMNLFLCGCLQSEGRSFLYGANQVLSFVLNMLVFDPLFMGVFKLGMLGAGISTIMSDGIPMILFSFLFLRGKFETKCKPRNFISKFSSKTWIGVKIGLTQLISHLCFSIPSIISRKYIEIGATKIGRYTEILAAFNPAARLWYFPGSYATALSISILPAMSYAHGAQLVTRTISLLKVGMIMTLVWCGAAEAVILGLGNYIAMLFSREESFVMLTWKIMFEMYLASAVMGIEMIAASFLQSMQYATAAIVLSILTRFLPVPLFGTILFFTDPQHNVFRTLLMYPISDFFSCIVGLLCVIMPIKKLKQMMKIPIISQNITNSPIEDVV